MGIYVVIVAAGAGRRVGGDVPKVLRPIAGQSSLERCLGVFRSIPKLSGIVVAVSEATAPAVAELLTGANEFTIPGGAERQDSVRLAVRALAELFSLSAEDIVLIHDGARPFPSPELIAALLSDVRKTGAVIPVTPASLTVKVCSEDGVILSTPPRKSLYFAQTPQAFYYQLILDAHLTAEVTGYSGTDDAELVERLGGQVRTVPGSSLNLKVTQPEDFLLAEIIAKERVNGW